MSGSGASELAIVAAPKPFHGHAGLIQRNAVSSWRSLSAGVDILLGGDAAGVAAAAAAAGATPLGAIEPGIDGPPRIDDLMAKAMRASSAPLMAYVNSDIILMPDWLEAVRLVSRAVQGDFLVIGRRVDLDVNSSIDFTDARARRELCCTARSSGRLAARVCKDFFVFPRDAYRHLPPFTLGRAFWDNWMVHDARRRGIPVVDITARSTAIHQNHDYAHLAGGRLSAYLTSPGARENRRLAGGSRMVSGAAASWRLDADGRLRRDAVPALLPFVADLPRFLGLSLAVFASGVAAAGLYPARFLTGSRSRSTTGQATGPEPKIPSRRAA
ncbi:MAG: hypothetical protein EBZ59_02470 [Planctomycetia bacterium]|nr:hypothetical protein [Planctomycetia bacterium]